MHDTENPINQSEVEINQLWVVQSWSYFWLVDKVTKIFDQSEGVETHVWSWRGHFLHSLSTEVSPRLL